MTGVDTVEKLLLYLLTEQKIVIFAQSTEEFLGIKNNLNGANFLN